MKFKSLRDNLKSVDNLTRKTNF